MKWRPATCLRASIVVMFLFAACSKDSTPAPSAPSPPAAPSATLTVTFGENPVPFRTTGCNASTPQGWYTSARLQETAGVSFTPRTFTQKLDGNVAGVLSESFNSRFGACSGGTFSEGVIPANGAVCGVVGVCTSSSYSNYQFELSGTDANNRTVTFVSPLLQLGARPAAETTLPLEPTRTPVPAR